MAALASVMWERGWAKMLLTRLVRLGYPRSGAATDAETAQARPRLPSAHHTELSRQGQGIKLSWAWAEPGVWEQ